ncbi:DNA-binding response regulator [Sporanaerobium hydrogeniformans]|uniref:DNA-binding response regulator n=1 Tax=Sporanaerobium hydrogeniformans TaxID=3072179 RepID=A0AC61D7E4_9FIRM|nr:response regulator transcription factor [Sporanaerobium hydrogeniformans]PHV69389.1 DNA-binding response regulator [Sporanaerobium hydrogeniformans]
MNQSILIIEDEVKIARFLQLELQHEGYTVDISHDGREGLSKALQHNYHLIILDVMLPSLNGMEVLRRIRQVSDMPVIMLTAKDDVMDKVMGLDLGAQDYMTKPFAIEELLARIRVVFKLKSASSSALTSSSLTCGKLHICPEKFEVSYDHIPILLTKREFELLHYLMLNKNIVLSREHILEKVWGYDYSGDTNVVDVYIRYLRSKIDQVFEVKIIHTVRGMGYQIKDV